MFSTNDRLNKEYVNFLLQNNKIIKEKILKDLVLTTKQMIEKLNHRK